MSSSIENSLVSEHDRQCFKRVHQDPSIPPISFYTIPRQNRVDNFFRHFPLIHIPYRQLLHKI